VLLKRTQRFTPGEERANALSAGIGIPLSLAALALVVLSPAAQQNGWHLGSVIVFGVALVVLYLSSTLNHSLPPGEGKEFFHNFGTASDNGWCDVSSATWRESIRGRWLVSTTVEELRQEA